MSVHVDFKVTEEGTRISVHNFDNAFACYHTSKVCESFDYVSVVCRINAKDLIMLHMNSAQVDDLILKLSEARNSLVAERNNICMETIKV